LVIDTNKITADLPASKAADELAKQPGMGWINDIKNNPSLAGKVDWKKIDEAHKNWSYDKTTMTPEMAAVVSLAVAYATGGAGSSILNAGMSTLASQATVSFINNGGDLSKVLNDLGSSQSVKGLVTSMVTAGVLQGLPNYLPTELQGVMNATAKSGFTDLLAKNLINNAASAVVNSAINGTSLEESLKTSIVSAIITTGMAKTANTIGDAASGKIEGVKLDEFGRSFAHAVAGCIAGTAKAGSGDGCTAGAVGAVVGELAAGFYNGDTGDGTGKPKADTTAFAALISGVAGALVGGDAQSVNIAASTGANAALNNYLNHAELTSKKEMQGLCSKGNDLACKAVIAYNDLDLKRNAALDACVGVVSPACDTVTTQASKDIQGLAGYAADIRNKFAQTGDPKYKQEMDNAQWELKEAAAGLKNYYYVASGGNVENLKGGTNANYAAYKYLEALTGDGVELGSALTGAPTANPGNKAMGRLTEPSAPPLSAADKRKIEIELNARTDDGQQYIDTKAPVQVPDTVVRGDADPYSTVNERGNPKPSIDDSGTLTAVNPAGKGDIKDQLRGANPERSPLISTSDPTVATDPKDYSGGTGNVLTIQARQAQRDINNGSLDGSQTGIVPPAEVLAAAQKQVDSAQASY
jgi:Possible hemagglutinin (DUF637)/Pre-toxin domain with VENN motif